MPHRSKPPIPEFKRAKKLVDEALEKSENRLPREEMVTGAPGWTDDDFVLKEMDGTHGRAYDAHFFRVNFNSTAEKWEKAIRATTAHEYAHTWHYEKRFDSEGRNDKIWQYVIDEALTQNFAEQVFPEYDAPQRKEHSISDISEYWPEIRDNELERDTDEVEWPYPVYIDQSDGGHPNWLGYSMSYRIGKELIEQGYELEDFPKIGKEELVETGNKLFGSE